LTKLGEVIVPDLAKRLDSLNAGDDGLGLRIVRVLKALGPKASGAKTALQRARVVFIKKPEVRKAIDEAIMSLN
jgi:hypothetical protein